MPQSASEGSRTDEERVAAIGVELADALATAIPAWIERVGVERARAAGIEITDELRAHLRDAGTATVDLVGDRCRAVVEADVDDGAGNPLAVLRGGLAPATDALRSLGVPEVERDEFSRRSFPADRYDLAPASFADVEPDLQELGLTWGAARAHIHLRRRAADR